MSAPTLDLPQLTGTREGARRLIESANLAPDLSSQLVLVNAGMTLAGTDSFADELIREILVKRHASRLIVSLAGSDLEELLKTAAQRNNVSDRLVVTSGPSDY